jgi:CheY-like chemotaxis protein
MSRQLAHLVRLVNDLLDVARVTTGRIELHREPIELAENVRACVNALGERLSAYDVKLEAEPIWVDGDPTRLEQIITNLLRNAAEFTPAGGRIRVSVKPENGAAVVRVEDNGIGISAELLPRIFDLFVQDKKGLDRAGGGLGIGLTLVKRLVELHGGTVQAASSGRGQGSTFTVRLPPLAAPLSMARADGAMAAADARRRVLIVEDNPDARESLRTILELSGHEIFEAQDGPSGVEQALRWKPDTALIDIGLPRLDGYEVARRIRSAPAGRAIFLIALTGYGQPGDRRLAEEAEFDAHLVKPVDYRRLSEAIAAGVRA